MHTSKCLPRETLKQYLAGWTGPEQFERIEAHLLDCPTCEQTMVSLEQDPDTLCDFVRASVSTALAESSGAAISDEVLEYALAKAKDRPLSEAEETSPWQPPTSHVGPYDLIRPLGHGGMGAVYLARHRQLGKEVAIKLLPARSFRNDHYAARFQREIRAAGQLHHAAIVSATDAGEDDTTHYLVMEYIDGLDLSRTIRLMGPLAIADACEIIRVVALGLSHAHAEGIVHRDVKPSNIMLGKHGDVKILDFGLAQVSLWDEISAELTTVGQLMGTLDYMAPEQAERADSVDYRADLYSLGATLFRLLCGRAPLAASPDLSPLAKLRLLGTQQPPQLDTLRADAPRELVRLMSCLLARDPAERPPSAAHVAEALGPFASGADLKALVATAVAKSAEAESHPLVNLARATSRADAAPSPTRGGGWRRWIVAAGMLPVLVWAGVFVVLETQKGQLVIESFDANVEVSLLRDGEFYEKLKIVPGVNTTRLYAGEYEVVIDAASDAFEIDRGLIEIHKGSTKVARIERALTVLAGDLSAGAFSSGAPNPRIPPASDAKLQPGDTLDIRSLREPEVLAQKVLVHADHTIKARLVGVVDVKGLDLQELEQRLNERYAAFIKEPGIEVFRDVGSVDPAPSVHASAAGQMPEQPYAEASATELMYDGRPLSTWLDQLARERSPAAMMDAVEAIQQLVNADNATRITGSLLQTLQGTPNMEISNGQISSNLDFAVFRIIQECQPSRRAYSELLVSELDRADDDWARRLLHKGVLVALGDAREEPTACLPIIDWIKESVLKNARRHALLDDAANVYKSMLHYADLDASVNSRLVADLVDCEELGPSFWLATAPPMSKDGRAYLAWNSEFVAQVEREACKLLAEPGSSAQLTAQAAMLLSIFGGDLYTRPDMPAPAIPVGTIAARIEELLKSPQDILRLTDIDVTFALEALPRTLEAGPVAVMNVNGLSYKSDYKASPVAELLKLVSVYDLPREPLRAELLAVIEVCKPTALLLAQKLNPNPYTPPDLEGSLLWPEMRLGGVRSSAREQPDTDRVTPVEWIAHFVLATAYETLPSADQQQVQRNMLLDLKRAWAGRQRLTADANSDGQLDYDEFSSMNLAGDAAAVDGDGDGFITIDELVRLHDEMSELQRSLQPGIQPERLEWAKRQIDKYDLNKDGELDASEWSRMIIKPTGADQNGDNRISVEEYAQFRSTR